MENFSPQNNSTSVKSPNDDFNNSYLDIYLFGKYNPIMEIIIGDEKEKDDYIQKFESKKYEDYTSLRQTPMDEEYNNTLNERLINKNNNDSKENNIEYKIDFDKFLNNFKNHEKEILSIEPYKTKNSIFNWNLNFYKDFGYLSSVKDIFENNFYQEQKNVLILFIDNLKTIYKVINIFDMIYNEIHPLFLFVINKKKIKVKKTEILNELNSYIKNKGIKRFNLRNVTLLEEVDLNETPENEELYNLNNKKKIDYIFDLYIFLINSWLYYNNLGDNFEFGSHLGKNSNEFLKIINNEKKNINMNSHVGLFNIIVLGRPGTGKSTLINILSNQKRSLEGRGESVTKKMIKYIIKDYNISLYDTPGFELDKDINEITKFINNVQKHLIQRKNQINMAFYLITEGARDFYENEKKILKILMENNIPIFFLITFSRDLEKGQEFKEIVEISLRRTLKLLDKNKGMAYYNEQIKVFPVHLLDENDGSCNNFGIKTVMEAAFDKFKHCIIEEDDLNNIYEIRDDPNRIKEIFNLLERKEIYKYFKDIDDILTYSISQSESVISNYSIVLCVLSFLIVPPWLFMTSLKTKLLKEIIDKFKKAIDDKEKEEIIKNNLKEIKNYSIFGAYIPIISIFYNYYNVRDFGNKYKEMFTEELKNAGIDGRLKFIKEFILGYNNAINGLKEIGKAFNE